ncbi:MAG: HEPN domain-containing protein [Acidobacteriota bacterium]
MTNVSLAQSYLSKARVRLTILTVLFDASAYSDVVREAQEIVELALKGMLRQAGVEPPHWHDVGGLVQQHADRFPAISGEHIGRLAAASAWLRKEREFAFYGDIDFLPTEQYDAATAQRAIDDARFVVSIAERVIVVT